MTLCWLESAKKKVTSLVTFFIDLQYKGVAGTSYKRIAFGAVYMTISLIFITFVSLMNWSNFVYWKLTLTN